VPDPVSNCSVPLYESHMWPLEQGTVAPAPTTDSMIPTVKVADPTPAIPGVIGVPVNTGLSIGAAPVICSTT
jgi:hypothetical protein